jgi:hypothetical protein
MGGRFSPLLARPLANARRFDEVEFVIRGDIDEREMLRAGLAA